MTTAAPRPETWDDYVGQEALKRRLRFAMISAKDRGKPLPPTLLLGPPGCGKTTMAQIIGATMGEEVHTHIMASLTEELLVTEVANFEGVLFLDEIHGASAKRQESLLPLLEDGWIQDRRGIKMRAKRLSIIAATTEGDKVIRPLYDRFMIRPPFEPYKPQEMAEIVKQMAGFEGMLVPDEWALEIGKASLGVPRNARSIVEMARDLMIVTGDLEDPETVLREASVTQSGLTLEHLRYLETLRQMHGKAGLDTIRQLMGMPAGHVEFLEVDLMKQGLIARESGGRRLNQEGFDYLTEQGR